MDENVRKQKIGIFGGTFDPIHMGHLMLAEAACDRFGLDKVLLMPTPSPYHRNDKAVTDLEKRADMVKLAIEGNDHLEFSDFEISLPGPTYTVNTLESFAEKYPDSEIYLIVGGDSLFSMESWKNAERIFELAVILSSKRTGESSGASGSCKPEDDSKKDLDGDTASRSSEESTEDFGLQADFDRQKKHLQKKYGARIYDIELPCIEISSKDIIRRIREGHSVKYYMPDSVIGYINDNNLYRS